MNSINLALQKSRYIQPYINKLDFILFLETSTDYSTISFIVPNFRHIISDRFILRLQRSSISSLDGQIVQRDLQNRLDEESRTNYFRINVYLSSSTLAIDDVNRINELRAYVYVQLNSEGKKQQILYILFTSIFYFELKITPTFFYEYYFYHGTIRCRLKGIIL